MGSEGSGLFGDPCAAALAALLRQRELEKAAQQFRQRDEQTNDCDDGLQDIAAALRQTRLETLALQPQLELVAAAVAGARREIRGLRG